MNKSSTKINEVLDCLKMKKSTNERMMVDKIYNAKNQRSSVVPKKSPFDFDMKMVKFSPKLPHLTEGPEGQRGENSPTSFGM